MPITTIYYNILKLSPSFLLKLYLKKYYHSKSGTLIIQILEVIPFIVIGKFKNIFN